MGGFPITSARWLGLKIAARFGFWWFTANGTVEFRSNMPVELWRTSGTAV